LFKTKISVRARWHTYLYLRERTAHVNIRTTQSLVVTLTSPCSVVYLHTHLYFTTEGGLSKNFSFYFVP